MRVKDKDLKQAVKDEKLTRAEAWELSDLRAEARRWLKRVHEANIVISKDTVREDRIIELERKGGLREPEDDHGDHPDRPTATEPQAQAEGGE